MSKLLEILGRGVVADTGDLICHWFNAVRERHRDDESIDYQRLGEVIELLGNMKQDSAVEQLRVYLFENSSCIYGRMIAAAICLKKNQLEGAIEELNSVYLRQPNNTMALYALGYCYERLGR